MTKTTDSRDGVKSQRKVPPAAFSPDPTGEKWNSQAQGRRREGKEGQNWNTRVSEHPGGKGGWLQGDLVEEYYTADNAMGTGDNVMG